MCIYVQEGDKKSPFSFFWFSNPYKNAMRGDFSVRFVSAEWPGILEIRVHAKKMMYLEFRVFQDPMILKTFGA